MSKNGLIEQVIASIPSTAAESTRHQLSSFITAYYRQLSDQDLADFGSEDLFGAALCHWELAQIRKPGSTLIRVYNPQIQEDSWQSSHTVIEIVTDDMPYLVMSLSMAVSAMGLNIHQTIHPIMQIRRNEQGQLLAAGHTVESDKSDTAAGVESLMHIEVDRLSDAQELDDLKHNILTTLEIINAVNRDQPAMQQHMASLAADMEHLSAENPELAESTALFDWIDERHFALLGIAEFTVQDNLELGAGSRIGPGHVRPGGPGPAPASATDTAAGSQRVVRHRSTDQHQQVDTALENRATGKS